MIIVVALCIMFIMFMVILYILYQSLSQPKNKEVAQGMKKFTPLLMSLVKQTQLKISLSNIR